MTTADTAEPRTQQVQPAQRRRGRALEEAIFEAVFGQLREVGYAGLTMDGVAAAARTGKASLYRRWPDKSVLVADALRDTLPSASGPGTSGDLRADLLGELRFMRDAFAAAYGTAFQVVAAEAGRDSGLVRSLINEQVIDPCVERIRRILGDAHGRGEVRAEAVRTTVSRIGPAMVTHHCVTEGGPAIADADLVGIVDDVLLPLVRTSRP